MKETIEIIIGETFDKDKILEACQYIEATNGQEPFIVVPMTMKNSLMHDIYYVFDHDLNIDGKKAVEKYKGYQIIFEDREDIVVKIIIE